MALVGYSELVDDAVARSGRLDRIADIKSYANAVAREVQLLGLCAKDLVEDTLTASVATSGQAYVYTRPGLLRYLRTVYYPAAAIWPKFILPGKIQDNVFYFYYAAANYYAFKGLEDGQLVNLAYYVFAPKLDYYAPGARPASYDPITDTFTYLDPTWTPDQQALAQYQSMNWIFRDWYDYALEGVLAKLYKAVGDDLRQRSSYALWAQYKPQIESVEGFESLGA